MKPRFLDHLRCPLDKTPLELREWESSEGPELSENARVRADRLGIDPKLLSKEILTGVLVNHSRKLLYPIHLGVPRLLTFSTAVGRAFAEIHGSQIRSEFPGYSLPDQRSVPGERDVLRSFSNEWVNYDWDSQSYWNLTPEAWFRCMRFVLELDRFPLEGKLALEVGMGIGGVADYLARDEGC